MQNNNADFIARHVPHLVFSRDDLDAFLQLPVPRHIPGPLKKRERGRWESACIVVGLCAPVWICLLVIPQFLFPDARLWVWTSAIAAAAIAAVSIVGGIRLSPERPSLLRDGRVTTGHFSFIDRLPANELRSAASRVPRRDLEESGTIRMQFEVDGQSCEVQQIVPVQYLELARWYHDTGTDILVLYADCDPTQARWVDELMFPCPEPPCPSVA